MAWTGDTAALLATLITEMPWDPIQRDVYYRNTLLTLLQRQLNESDFTGDYYRIRNVYDEDLSVEARQETGDVLVPGRPSRVEGRVYPLEVMGSVGWTVVELEDAIGQVGLANVVDQKLSWFPRGFGAVLNAYFNGDGTGRLGRVSAWSSPTVTVDNTQASFGWSKCELIRKGMLVDIYTVPDIAGTSAWTAKVRRARVHTIDRAAGTFQVAARTNDTTSAIDTADPADGDFVFLAGSVALTSAVKFSSWLAPAGIHQLVDDGQDVGNEFNDGSSNSYNHCWSGATFQGQTRASYPWLLSKVFRAGDWASGGTDGTAATATVDDIEAILRWLYQDNDAGDPENLIMCMNSGTRSWLTSTAGSEQNIQQDASDGLVVPGLVTERYRSQAAGGQLLPIFTVPTLSNGCIVFLNLSDYTMFERFPLNWYSHDGNTQFEAPGARNLTRESWLRWRGNIGARRCDRSARMEDINIAA